MMFHNFYLTFPANLTSDQRRPRTPAGRTCALCSSDQTVPQDLSHPALDFSVAFTPHHRHNQVRRGQAPVSCHQGVDDLR